MPPRVLYNIIDTVYTHGLNAFQNVGFSVGFKN